MSISSRITEMETHIGNIYDTLEVGGADLTNVNKNILNIDAQLKDRYLDYLNNGTDEIWNNWEKVTATNVNEATLNNTVEAPMKIDLKGNTFQQSYNGYNLQNGVAGFSRFVVANATYTTDSTSITVTSTATTRYSGLELFSISTTNGKTYTVSMKATYDTDGLPNFRLGKGNNLVANIIGTGTATLVDNSYYNIVCTFTADSDFTLDIMLYPSYTTNTTTHTAKFYDFQIVEGATEKPFEPYVGGKASPNPDYPQAIHNVSGENNIKIENKNLFGVSFQRGYWKTDGTYNAMTENTTTMSTPKFKLKSGSYIISNSKITSWQWYIIDWTDGNYSAIQKYSTKTFTLTRDSILSFQFNTSKGSGIAVEPYLEELTEYMMLEYNSTATSYVAHQEQNLPFSLKSKNLFDKNTMSEHIYRFIPDINTWTPAADSYSIKIPCEPNKTYTISHNTSDTTFFRCGYVTATDEEINSNSAITLYDGYRGGTVKSHTVTTGEGATYLVFQSNGSMMPYIIETLQVEESSTPTTYEPYYNYELCKIDTAQDYFYKDSGKWYIHKEIGSVSYNGTETFAIANVDKLRYPIRTADVSNMKKTSSSIITGILSNMFVANTSSETSSFYQNSYTFRRRGDYAQFYMFFPKDFFTATSENAILSEWGTFLTQQYNNGTPLTFYYELETPTNTEITDATLISQLEALLQAKSYDDQTNVSQTNNDLPFILDITALKNI